MEVGLILVPVEQNNGKLKPLPPNMRVSEFKKQSSLCCNDLAALIFIVIGKCYHQFLFLLCMVLKGSLIKKGSWNTDGIKQAGYL